MSTSPDTIYFSNGGFLKFDQATAKYTFYSKTGTALLSINTSGDLYLTGAPVQSSSITLAGKGNALIVAAPAPSAGNVIAKTNYINFTPPASSGMVFRLTAMVNVTAWTTPASFTVVVGYTDSNGTAQTETLTMFEGDGTASAVIDEVERFYCVPLLIVPDNSTTAITLSTTGTFSGSPVYTIAAILERLI